MRAATKKNATFGATLWVPEFLRLEKFELQTVLGILRDRLTIQVYLLLLVHSDFETGEFNGIDCGYHRLQELCTPPAPERGARLPAPTIKQIRRAVDDLIAFALVKRDAMKNALQGQLRLHLMPRKKKATPEQLDGRVQGKVTQCENPMPARVAEESPVDSGQVSGHGFQGVKDSLNGLVPAELSTTAGDITSPPEGGENGPHGPVGGQVEASPLMAGDGAPELLTPQPPLHEGEQQPVFSSEGGGAAPSAGREAAKALAEKARAALAERQGMPSKERYGPKKPMPIGLRGANRAGTNGIAPPSAQNQKSMVAIGDYF